MKPRFPRPLDPGDTVAVTSPSGGVPPALKPRLEFAVETVRSRGFEVLIGECMDGNGATSAPARERARELQDFLLDPEIRAVIPPWGGELAIDLIPCLDWQALAEAEPTWVIGYSDISTLLLPLTLNAGVATVHGNNLLDTPFAVPEGLVGWMDVVSLPRGASFTQDAPDKYREGYVLYETFPEVAEFELTEEAYWVRLDGAGDVRVRGRLIGGCIETLGNLAGTPFGRASELARSTGDPLIVYVEAANADAYEVCRTLHGMRLAGFFESAAAVLVGRTNAPDCADMNQYDAVIDALGGLGVPIIADVECGHVAPFMPLVNGATAEVVATETQSQIRQTLA